MAVLTLKRKLLIALALVLLLGAAVGGAFLFDDQLQFKVTGKHQMFELEGQLAPAFTAPLLGTSETVSLSDVRGKPTMLVFFASFCPVCKVQMPVVQELIRTSDIADEVNIYGVNGHEYNRYPIAARARRLQRHMREEGLEDIPALVAPVEMQEAFKLSAVPSIVVLDRDGRVSYVGLSNHSGERLESLLRDVL